LTILIIVIVTVGLGGEVLVGAESLIIVLERLTSEMAVKGKELDEVVGQELRLLASRRLGLSAGRAVVWS
jgi:hypothetical protein